MNKAEPTTVLVEKRFVMSSVQVLKVVSLGKLCRTGSLINQ